MKSFEAAIQRFPLREQKRIRKKLLNWGSKSSIGRCVVKNMDDEYFLSVDNAEEMLKFILNFHLRSYKSLEKSYSKECIKYVLSGGPIRVSPAPKIFGSAIEVKAFHENMMRQSKTMFGRRPKIDDFIKRLEASQLSPWEATFSLKEHSVWTTWSEAYPNFRPFDFCKTSHPDEVRSNMGLERLQISDKLILFFYTIPTGITVNRPTVADAQLSEYFSPPPDGREDAGRTVNWQREKHMKKFSVEPRPEGIHSTIKLDSLSLPVVSR